VAERIIKNFDKDIIHYYNEEDKQRGCIESIDRRGLLEEFPIMSISLSGVFPGAGKFETYLDINDACVELKKLAKSRPGSNLTLEMRSS